jgi:hypothetical protein
VRWVRTFTTDWLSSCKSNLFPLSSRKKDMIAERTSGVILDDMTSANLLPS